MTETVETGPEGTGFYSFKPGDDFIAQAEVNQALAVVAELDSAATTAEVADVKKVLGDFPDRLVQLPLAQRMREQTGLSLRFEGAALKNYDGTTGRTKCRATYQGESATDSGPSAPKYPRLLARIPVATGHEAAGRSGAVFAVTISVYVPQAPLSSPLWKPPSIGGWAETLAHELIVHGEPYADDVRAYRAGTAWPGQVESTQHWMFIYAGLPRYLLWLRRLRDGPQRDYLADFLNSIRTWADDQLQKKKPPIPPSVSSAIAGTPLNPHLRELAALFHLNPPAEDGDNTELTTQIQEKLIGIASKSPLWWLPS